MAGGGNDPTRYLEYLREQARGIEETLVPLAAFEVLRHQRVVIAGESTFVKYVASLWACGLLDARTWTLLFPIFIPMAELAEGESLIAFLSRWNEELGWGLCAAFFREKLESGAALVLIDAPDGAEAGRIEAAMREWPGCRLVVMVCSEAA